MERGQVGLSILPLSHILERMGDYCYFYRGCTIAYAESVLKVGENLREVRPHLFAAVPRLFEKMRTTILDGVAVQPASKQKIFKWALTIGEQRYLIYHGHGWDKAMELPALVIAMADAVYAGTQ